MSRVRAWLLVLALVLGGGGAVGPIVKERTSGLLSTTVGQAVIIDASQFTIEDLSAHAKRRFVSVSDDGTSFTAAAEIATGEELVIDVPLVNLSNKDLTVELVFKIEGSPNVTFKGKPFWTRESFTKSVSDGTITRTGTTPVPPPITTTEEQSKDAALETNAKPSGSVTINPQTANAAPTLVQPPGTPPISSQTSDGTATSTTAVSGTPPTISPRSTTKTSTTSKPSGLPDNTAQTKDASPTTVAPTGADGDIFHPRNTTQTHDLTALGVSGTAPISSQTADTSPTTTKPDPDLPDSKSGKWYLGSFQVDLDADGSLETVNFVLTDTTTSGTYDTMDISVDDNDYGEGDLSNGVADTDDDERLTASGDVRLGGHYTFTVAFDPDPNADADDARITSKTWFFRQVTDTTKMDLDGDGSADDDFYIVLSDTNSNGLYDTIDISIEDKVFGEGNLTDSTVDFGEGDNSNDERFGTTANEGGTQQDDIVLGTYTFNLRFDSNPPNDPSDFRYRNITWFVGELRADLNADGDTTDAEDVIAFSLSDSSGGDALYDTLDFSTDDGALGTTTFGEGALNNGITGSDDDERLTASGNVRLGSFYTFFISFASNPGLSTQTQDVSMRSVTWFTGSLTIDADADGVADDQVNFALADEDSDGLYDKLHISSDDAAFREGTLDDQKTSTDNDEETDTPSGEVVKLQTYDFLVEFSTNPGDPGAFLARITSRTAFTGTFNVDVDADGTAGAEVNWALFDTDSDGLYDTLDLSTDDAVFGEGNLDNDATGSDDDERDSAPDTVRLGSFYTFSDAFASNPAGTTADASLTSKTWFVGTLTLDANGDGDKADPTDTLNFALTDTDSDGLYERLDLSLDDAVYGEGGALTNGKVSTAGDDEYLLDIQRPKDLTLGRYLFTTTFASNPGAVSQDVSITSKTWFTSNGFAGTPFEIDADGDGLADEKVAWAVSDTDSDGLYDRIDLSMNDTDFGDGNKDNDRVGLTEADDETASLGEVLVFGDTTDPDAPYFSISRLDKSPVGDADPTKDVGLKSPWYVGTFSIDIDGDQEAEELDFVLVDPGTSDGIYTKLNLDRDDSGAYSSDEVHESGDLVLLGGMKIRVTFPTTAASLTFTQGKIIEVLQLDTNRFLIRVPADADPGGTQDNVRIGVALPDDAPPGFLKVRGEFRVVSP